MERRTLLKGGLATTFGGLLIPAADGLTAEAEARPRRGKTLARNLRTPWGIAFLPSGHALVGERDSGRIYRVKKGGGRRLVGRVRVHSQKANWGEGGLLGLALHPRFRRNHWVYAYISTRRDNRIVRMKYRNGRLGKRQLVLKGIPTNVHHNGGRLAFGPGGFLFASTGDGEVGSRAQNKKSLGGKILRMTSTGKVPRNNPFNNYTWSYGHRNIEGLAFDPRGRLWASEFGDKDVDELNLIRKGHNYGWPRVEGGDGRGGYHDPLATWQTENCSPSGVAIANGHAFLGGLRGHCIWRVKLNGRGRGRRTRFFYNDYGRIRTVQKAPDGSLWMTTSNHDGRPSSSHPNDDRVIRVRV